MHVHTHTHTIFYGHEGDNIRWVTNACSTNAHNSQRVISKGTQSGNSHVIASKIHHNSVRLTSLIDTDNVVYDWEVREGWSHRDVDAARLYMYISLHYYRTERRS